VLATAGSKAFFNKLLVETVLPVSCIRLEWPNPSCKRVITSQQLTAEDNATLTLAQRAAVEEAVSSGGRRILPAAQSGLRTERLNQLLVRNDL
jgi:hypothetical protein